MTPLHSTWNDFGYRFFTRLHVYTVPEGLAYSVDMRLMFKDKGNTPAYLDELFTLYGSTIERNQITDIFCSVLLEDDAYRKIVSMLTLDEAIYGLAQLGDAVVLEATGVSDSRLELIRSEPFHKGALRSGDAYAAWRRAKRHLRRDPPEPVADAASNFEVSTQLPNLANPYKVEFDFDKKEELLRNRIAVLIGRNGVGKTQFLLSMIKAAARLAPVEQFTGALAEAQFNPEPAFNSLLAFSSVSSDPYPESIAPWEGGIDYHYFSLIDRVARNEPGVSDTLTASLADIVRSNDVFKTPNARAYAQTRANILRAALEPHVQYDSIHLPLLSEIPTSFARVVILADGKYVPIHPSGGEGRTLEMISYLDWTRPPVIVENGRKRRLSSGQLAMLRFAVQAVGSVQTGSLLLMDEPETHLHPNFISHFIEILHSILEATRSCAIIATHSAYIVREVPRSRVLVLRVNEEDSTAAVSRPRLQTFGASIDSISQFVFGDAEIEHLHEMLLGEWLRNATSIEAVLEKYGEELNPESLSYIRRVLDKKETQ